MARATTRDRTNYDEVSSKMMRVIACMLVAICIMVGLFRLSGQEPFGQPQLGPILAERVVHLDGDARGAALITDAAGETITEYGAGEGGFVSTIDRGIQFRRHQLGADETAPVIVRMHEGSIVSIYDPEVDHSYTLLSYGPDNIAHFAALVTPPAE